MMEVCSEHSDYWTTRLYTIHRTLFILHTNNWLVGLISKGGIWLLAIVSYYRTKSRHKSVLSSWIITPSFTSSLNFEAAYSQNIKWYYSSILMFISCWQTETLQWSQLEVQIRPHLPPSDVFMLSQLSLFSWLLLPSSLMIYHLL